MKEALGTLLRLSGLDRVLRAALARGRVSIVVYHDPAPETLERHLAWLAGRYSFITMDRLADALEGGVWDTLPAYPLVVTFDDGHRRNAALEAILRAHNVRPTIFLCSRIIGTRRPFWWQTQAAERLGIETLKRLPDGERRRRLAEAGDDPDRDGAERQAMTWEEVRALSATCDFGAHTRTHPVLPRCDERTSGEEIAASRTEVEAFTQRPCRHFAYPNGDFGDREVRHLRRAGYRTARTIEAGWNGPEADPFRLAAFPVSDDASVSWLAVQMTGVPAWLRRLRPGERMRGVRRPVRPLPAG